MSTHFRIQADASKDVSFSSNGTRQIPSELIVHHAWDFLDVKDKISLCVAAPVFSCYAKLRQKAASLRLTDIKRIVVPLDHSSPVPPISVSRATAVASLLLLVDFDCGQLIRALGGKYVGDFLDFAKIEEILFRLELKKDQSNGVEYNFPLLRDILRHGAPIQGNYSCDRYDTLRRNLYNNHSASYPHTASILEKVASDVHKSYAIALPRWILRFIDGLFLAALGYATREHKGKIKGRHVNDPSAHLFPDDSGAINDQIKKGIDFPDVYYMSCLQRVWERAYNLRIRYPDDDIIVYKDDLVTAFRRVRYHPDLAAAHCFVLGNFLILPIGLVFGARDSPSWFTQISELRAFLSEHYSSIGLAIPDRTIIDAVTFPDEPPVKSDIAPAYACSVNTGDVSSTGQQNVFVDDTIMVELRSLIQIAAVRSVAAADILIGHHSLVEPAVSVEKFEKYFRHINETLGFMIDTRELTASYPVYKREKLLKLLSSFVWKGGQSYPVRTLAQILGTIRNLAQILPFGVHLSIHLQLCLSDYLKREIFTQAPTPETLRTRIKKAWESRRRVHISPFAANNINYIRDLLLHAPDSIWSRPIGLLIPRDPHFICRSDACNVAMGGYCVSLPFQWRLSNSLFTKPHKSHNNFIAGPMAALHINVHEFIAIIINTFFAMVVFRARHQVSAIPASDGHVFLIQADNTSALSWMKHASRSRDPHIVNLSHLLSSLVFFFNQSTPSNFSSEHLAGTLNEEADALSRPQLYPTYQDVFAAFPSMKALPAFRPPRSLISIINSCISTTKIWGPSKQRLTRLLSTEERSLRLIAKNGESSTLQ